MRVARRPDIMDDLARARRSQPPRPPIYVAGASARVYSASDQSIPNATLTAITFEAENWDTDTMHFNSAAALTGTVAKTAGGSTLVGAGTTFTTQLSVGQAIQVPGGGGTETAVITAVTDNTHVSVAVGGAGGVWAFTASGQTATRINSPLVANTPGTYQVSANCIFDTNPNGRRQLDLRFNGNNAFLLDSDLKNAVTDVGAATRNNVSTPWRFQQWDYVEAVVLQASGGALNVKAAVPPVSPALGMVRVGPA